MLDPASRSSVTETAVYVHGLGGSATNWTDLAALIGTRLHGMAIDLPGFGRSEPTNGYDYTLDSHLDTVTRFIVGLDRGPVHLFGNSFGGTIAIAIAARRPELVKTLTLVSPAVPELCFADPRVVPERRLVEAVDEYAERTTLSWSSPALANTTIGMIKAWLAPRSRSIWRLLPQVNAPALVVWGTQDRLVAARKAPRTARLLPRGRLLMLPRTGHVAQMERPMTVARAVLGMWDAVERHEW